MSTAPRPPDDRSATRGPSSSVGALSVRELVALVRATGGVVGGAALWDPRNDFEVRRMLTLSLELEGVLPLGSVAELDGLAGRLDGPDVDGSPPERRRAA